MHGVQSKQMLQMMSWTNTERIIESSRAISLRRAKVPGSELTWERKGCESLHSDMGVASSGLSYIKV